MMLFDERFGENVREVFDNYQERVDEKAWQQMKKRLQAKSKTPFFIMGPFWNKAAAAIAILMAITGCLWLFFLYPEKTGQVAVYKKYEDSPAIADVASDDTHPDGFAENEDIEYSPQTGVQQINHITQGREEFPDEKIIAQTIDGIQDTVIPAPDFDTRRLQVFVPQLADIPDFAGDQRFDSVFSYPGMQADGKKLFREIKRLSPGEVSSGMNTQDKLVIDDTDTRIIHENLERLNIKETSHGRIPLMEVSAGSMKTWSPREMAGGVGYAAGVAGDWPVGDRLSISGGGLLVYNQFKLGNTTGAMKYAGDEEMASLPHFDAAERYQVLQQKTTTDFVFTAIDIPVNIRYIVSEMARSRIYVSAGFSSFIYLQQSYNSRSEVLAEYTAVNSRGHQIVETGYAIVTSGGEFDAFRRMDLARFFNLSLGYVIRGKNHAMVIEPFIKYPLGDVTDLNLNVGMAGFSLKYRPDNR